MSSAALICPRCPAKVGSMIALEAHLVEHHLMSAAKAQRDARLARNGHAPPEAESLERTDHVCGSCGAAIPCDWKAIGDLDKQAHRLKSMAGQWRAKLEGRPIGTPRTNTFDVEAARRLVAGGMSYRAVAEALGATSKAAVFKAVNGAKRA